MLQLYKPFTYDFAPLWKSLTSFDFDDLFCANQSHISEYPKAQVAESDNSYEFRVELPGFSKDQVSLTIQDEIIEIKANKQEKNDKWKCANSYHQKLSIPENTSIEGATAEFTDGILLLSIPKSKKNKVVKSIELR